MTLAILGAVAFATLAAGLLVGFLKGAAMLSALSATVKGTADDVQWLVEVERRRDESVAAIEVKQQELEVERDELLKKAENVFALRVNDFHARKRQFEAEFLVGKQQQPAEAVAE